MKKIHLFFLIAIVAIAIIPRFYNIIDQGFVSWDEGMYMNEALFYESIIHNMPLIFSQLLTRSLTAHTVEEMIEGWPPSSAKPAHSFFIYLFTIFVGMHISASKILAASFGVLTVIMLFIFIRSWYGNVIGMIAALFLAVSGYHIYVSRLGVPETDSMFFFILGWYLFGESIKNKKIFKYKYIILCGLTLGLSFTLCYRWIVAIPIIWLCELIRFFQNKQNGKITLLKRMSILSA